MSASIESLRAQLQQLQAHHASGAIDAATYEPQRAALERALLDAVMAPPATSAVIEAPARPSVRLVALLALAVLVVAADLGGEQRDRSVCTGNGSMDF